jgi:hypothetical protein
MITGITVSFVNLDNGNEITVISQPFETPLKEDDKDVDNYILKLKELIWKSDNLALASSKETIILKNIDKLNGFFKMVVDRD